MRRTMADEIILASASPRRALLLGMLGIPFRTYVTAVSEDFDACLSATEQAHALALAKARAASRAHPGRVVLAADTLISFRGRLLGKPSSPDAHAALAPWRMAPGDDRRGCDHR